MINLKNLIILSVFLCSTGFSQSVADQIKAKSKKIEDKAAVSSKEKKEDSKSSVKEDNKNKEDIKTENEAVPPVAEPPSKVLDILKISFGVGLSKIQKSKNGDFDSNGNSQLTISYKFAKSFLKSLRPNLGISYQPLDVVVRKDFRTYRGVVDGYFLSGEVVYSLKQNHKLTSGLLAGLQVPRLEGSDFLSDPVPDSLKKESSAIQLALGYEYSLLETLSFGSKLSFTSGDLTYSSLVFYSAFVL